MRNTIALILILAVVSNAFGDTIDIDFKYTYMGQPYWYYATTHPGDQQTKVIYHGEIRVTGPGTITGGYTTDSLTPKYSASYTGGGKDLGNATATVISASGNPTLFVKVRVEYSPYNCNAGCRHCCVAGSSDHPDCSGRPIDCSCHVKCGDGSSDGENCNACCRHKCKGSDPSAHGACDNTNGPGGCSCHENGSGCGDGAGPDDTCNACCSHKCKGSDPSAHGDCSGHKGLGGCDCHEDEEQCTCGACCECKCKCGHWNTETQGHCIKTCSHKCTKSDGFCTCELNRPTDFYTHCECHHSGEAEKCCEHHKYDFTPPPDIKIKDPGPVTIKDPGPLTDPGPLKPINFDSEELPMPDTPMSINPGNRIPESLGFNNRPEFETPDGSPHKNPLRYFRRTGVGEGFPEFDYESVSKELSEKLNGKLPLESLERLNGGGGGSQIDLSWTVGIDWGTWKFGPYKFDLRHYLNEYLKLPFSNVLRQLVLFTACVWTLLGVLGLIFNAK